jgi:hypothetical protein
LDAGGEECESDSAVCVARYHVALKSDEVLLSTPFSHFFQSAKITSLQLFLRSGEQGIIGPALRWQPGPWFSAVADCPSGTADTFAVTAQSGPP